MEVKNLQNEEASTSKKESLNISEDTLKTAKEKIFRLKKEAKKGKQNSKGKRSSLNGTVGKKKVTRRPIVYIGHLPHGFYEEELRSFFSQFGQVCRVKVSRSKKTGQSKGYAFVEFSDDDVARIAAETMNNYLMFERLLKTKYIPAQKVHQKMFPSKWITPESYPALERRNKILKKQEEKPTNEEVKKHRAKVLKSITRSLAVLQGLGINDYLPLVYDPPQNAAKEIQEETKVEACEASAAENTKIETNEDQVQEKAVPAAAENIGDVKPALGTPVVKKLTKATVKTPAKLPGTDSSEAVKTATPKVSKPTSAKTPAKPATSTSTESPKTVAEDAAKLAPVKTPARAPIASSTKTPARATEGNSVEATEVSKPDVAKTPAKVSKAQSTEPAIATPPASKTPGKPIGSDSTEAAKRTLISKATPAKTPGKPVVGIAKTPAKSTNNKAAPAASPKDAMVSESVTATAEAKQPTPAKTPVGQVTASQSPIPTPDKSADKPTPAETSEQTSETASVGVAVEETPANAEEQVTETAAKPNPAKRALAKSDVSTPAKTPKKVATPKRTAREVAGKTPKKEIVSEATEKITEKMDVDDIPKAEVSDATKEESSKAQEATTPAKTPKKTPAKQIPKTDSKETPKVAGAEQKATPAKTSPMKRPAEVGEDASPAKVAAIRTPVSILKSPAGRVVVTPLSAEKADVVLTPKSPAITPPTRRLTRAAAKRMSLKISPKMDVVFSPRVTRKVAGTPSTPAGRRKSVKP